MSSQLTNGERNVFVGRIDCKKYGELITIMVQIAKVAVMVGQSTNQEPRILISRLITHTHIGAIAGSRSVNHTVLPLYCVLVVDGPKQTQHAKLILQSGS